jgi:hypothetical protein
MGVNTVCGFTMPNLGDLGTILAGSANPGFPAGNLQSPQVSTRWQSAAGDVLPGGASVISPGGGAAPLVYPSSRSLVFLPPTSGISFDSTVQVVALINDNSRVITGSAAVKRWRVRCYRSSATAYHLLQITRPAFGAATSVTNLTGALSANNAWNNSPTADFWLGQPSSWLTAVTKTSNTQFTSTFNASQTDGGQLPLKAGANLQTFLVYLRASGSSGTSPSLSIDLVQGGSVVANLWSGAVIATGTTPLVAQVQWNASLLSALTATNVGIRCSGTAGTANTLEFAAVQWIAEHNGYLYDSGDLAISYPVFIGGQTFRVFNLTSVLGAPFTCQFNSITGFIDSILVDQVSSDAYAAAGRLNISDMTLPFGSMDWNWDVDWADPSVVSPTPGGQEWIEVRPQWRLAEFVNQNLTETESDAIFSQLKGTVGIHGNFLWIPDTANLSTAGKWAPIWGRFAAPGPVKNPRLARYSMSQKFKEAL